MTAPEELNFDVAIAGGNHSGLALGLALAATLGSGVRIAIVEPRDAPAVGEATQDPRAFALSDGSRRLLQAVGVWAALADHATPVHSIDITDSGLDHVVRPVLLSYANRTSAGTPASWIVEPRSLQQSLLAQVRAAPDIRLLAPAAVIDLAFSTSGVSITLQDGRRLRAGLLAAADGARSPLRHRVGIKSTTWSTGQVGIVQTVRHAEPHHGRAVQHFLPSGPFAILPLAGNRSSITWSEVDATGRQLVEGADDRFLAEVERRFDYRLGAVALEGPRALWPLEFHMARALTAPRLALVGDAARTVHPIAGQGLNLALRDVAALADCVGDAMSVGLSPGDLTVLERYEQWRRFDASSAAAVFGALNAMFSNDQPVARAVRSAGLSAVDRLEGLKRLLVEEAAGLTGELPRLMREPAWPDSR